LEREQEAIDQKASNLEAKLRAVMGGNPSNNQRGTNPFLRLIRNSIGGGDVIRIKLLESDDESLFGSGISDDDDDDENALSDTCSNSSIEMQQICEDQVIEMQPRSRSRHQQQTHQQRQRPRAHSCFVNTNENCTLIRPTYQQQHHLHDHHRHGHQHTHPHHVHHVDSYNHSNLLGNSSASGSSSRQSLCDNLQAYYADNDDDALVMASTGHAATSRRHRVVGHKRGQHQHRRRRSHGFCGNVVCL